MRVRVNAIASTPICPPCAQLPPRYCFVPAGTNFDGQRIVTARELSAEGFECGKSRSKPEPRIHHFFHRAAEVDVNYRIPGLA